MPIAFLSGVEATIRPSGQFAIGLSLPDRCAGSSNAPQWSVRRSRPLIAADEPDLDGANRRPEHRLTELAYGLH